LVSRHGRLGGSLADRVSDVEIEIGGVRGLVYESDLELRYHCVVPVRVELRRDAGRVGPGHGPWIRRRQIARVIGFPDPHELGQVLDRRGETIGWGLVSAVSSITVRMVSFTEQPPPSTWLEDRLEAAFAARRAYRLDDEGTTGVREVNTEGDGLPGLVIDRYTDDLVVQITTAPMAARQDAVLDWLRANSSCRLHVLLPDRAAKHEGFEPGRFSEHERTTLRFMEHGLSFEVPAPPSQKTGAYFDQRANHRTIAHLARRHGGAMLDLGCHVGGFALHARKLGVPVVGVDSSKVALEYAARNAATNELEAVWVDADLFSPLDDPRLDGPFGTIVVDPPKIAARKSDVDRALAALQRVVDRMAARLEDDGHLVVCSCSHHIEGAHLDRLIASLPSGHRFTRVQVLGAGFDHPVMPGHREGEYLRVHIYQKRRAGQRHPPPA
jgi:23S rRNA (cytosine1962-C5)-methyltransferase